MRLVLALVVVLGCQPGHEDFPLDPGAGGPGGGLGGGDGGGGGGGTDAPTFEGMPLSGHVCQLSDLRIFDLCDPSGVGNLTVTLGTRQAITADNGDFVIENPGGTGLVWRVTGSTVVTSTEPFSSSQQVHTIRTSTYGGLLLDNGAVLVSGEGAIVEQILATNVPVADATATVAPTTPYKILYDTDISPTTWNENKTGTHGVVWIPINTTLNGVANVNLTIKPPNNGTPQTVTRTVIDQGITFGSTGL